MQYKPINLQEKLDKFSEHWSPRIIAQLNDYHFKLVKFQGQAIKRMCGLIREEEQ